MPVSEIPRGQQHFQTVKRDVRHGPVGFEHRPELVPGRLHLGSGATDYIVAYNRRGGLPKSAGLYILSVFANASAIADKIHRHG